MTSPKQRGLARFSWFQGVAQQHCRVHFARNLLVHVPKAQADYRAAAFRMIFAQTTPADVHAAWDETRDDFAARFPKLGSLMDQSKADILASTAFPREHWRRIRSTHPPEPINKEIQRHRRVVGVVPSNAAAIRLVGAALLDMHDERTAGDRRYLSEGSMAKLYELIDNHDNVAIDSGE